MDQEDGRGRLGAALGGAPAGAGLWLGGAPASGAGRGRRAGLLPFPPGAPAAAALPGRRGGGAEEPRRLLLFECARPGAVSLGSVVVSLSSFPSAPHSRRLTAAVAAAEGGAWLFEAEWRRGEGRRGGGAAAAGGGAVCPGTERPRPWRTPISSSTSSSATQVRPGARRPTGREAAARGPGPRGKRRRAAAQPRSPPGASPPLHFRSAGAGDVGTASGRGLARRPRPGPGRACNRGPRQPFHRPVWGVDDRGAGLALRVARPARSLSPWASPPPPRREKGGPGRAEGDGRRVLASLTHPTFSDPFTSATAWAKRSPAWDS